MKDKSAQWKRLKKEMDKAGLRPLLSVRIKEWTTIIAVVVAALAALVAAVASVMSLYR